MNSLIVQFTPFNKQGSICFFHAKLKNKLVQSLQYLFDINRKNIGHFVKNIKLLKLLNSDVKIPAAYYALNSILLEATINKNIHLISPDVFAFCHDQLQTSIKYYNYSEIEVGTISQQFEKYMLFDLPPGSYIEKPELQHSLNLQKVLKEALKLISRVDDDLYKEMLEFVSEFMIIQSNAITAGSSFDLFGLIYINMVNSNCSKIRMADIIIHEAAHLYLYCMSAEDPLVLNEYSEEFFSPIKGKNRPMIGIYHAAFVLARVLSFLFKARKVENLLSKTELIEAEQLIQRYTKIVVESLHTVRSKAQLSEKGNEIISYVDNIITNGY